ncbi:MAG: membrane protein insertase YidC [Erythrobacter sp.]|uniref:membrane protein insertase YidC n=1 Tax=Erythrobacter sp. TaxID=1042 RepID=UPI003C7114C4
MDNQRNLLLAVVLSGLLILGWDLGMRYFYPEASVTAPVAQTDPVAQPSAQGAAGTTVVATDVSEAAGGAVPGDLSGIAAAPAGPIDLSGALADPRRVVIDTPAVAGSINLVGARIDDLVLKNHRESVDEDSGPVRLFAPERTDAQYFAEFGFILGGERVSSRALWQADGEVLSPGNPVTLTRAGANGVTLAIELSIDDNYMITARQMARNGGGGATIVQPFALVNRTARTATPDQFIAHAGPVGVFGDTLYDPNSYEELAEIGRDFPQGRASWLGFTDNYWLSALIPGSSDTASVGFRSLGNQLFRSDLIYEPQTVPAGGTLSETTRLYAGAKESEILDAYEESGITLFGKAISWGWFQVIEKPLLWLLRQLDELAGNFGVAIILLTVVIRALLFPIAQKQFSSMAQMKAVQPKMKAIQERYKDDKQRQQQEIMKLYKEEKVNPLAGCLPLVIQIPIFFALYKVLILSIEMRHEPFIEFWIKDLSAPDPAKILNLFGILPYDVPGFLGIGILAILLGVTMWLTFKLNPSAMDPMQQQIFNIMPWILMFIMAPFAAGLLLYWVTSNLLTLAQQSYLYSRHPQLRAAADKEKAEREQKKAREAEEKAKA